MLTYTERDFVDVEIDGVHYEACVEESETWSWPPDYFPKFYCCKVKFYPWERKFKPFRGIKKAKFLGLETEVYCIDYNSIIEVESRNKSIIDTKK